MATTPDVLQAAVQTLMVALRTAENGKLADVFLDAPDEDDMFGRLVGWVDLPAIVTTNPQALAHNRPSSSQVEWLVNAYISVWENDASSSRTRKYLNLFVDAMLTTFMAHTLGGVDATSTGIHIQRAWIQDAPPPDVYEMQGQPTYGLAIFPIHYLERRVYTAITP